MAEKNEKKTRENLFTDQKKARAIQWINEKCPNLVCECCKEKSWVLSEDLVMPMPFKGVGPVIRGPSYPIVMVICKNCGNSKFFNAVIIGIVDKEDGTVDQPTK